MTDVAKTAGVSQSTVSMVLNGVPGARLSAETRERVLRVAFEAGYRLPQRQWVIDKPGLPQTLSGETTAAVSQRPGAPVIGYLVDEISTSPHPVVSLDGARDAAWEQGCNLIAVVTRNNAEQERAAMESLLSHPGLLGIVYSTIFTREVQPPASLSSVPAVLLNCHDGQKRFTAIVPAEVAGGHTGTEHLIEQGHRRIGFINGEPWMEASQDRLKGYRRALASADLAFDATLVRDGDWMSGTGFRHTQALMALDRPPSAIFCANDLMALGALEALQQLGLRVPEDISVMGYDDQEISRHTHPPLSTVVLPNYEMGQAAVETLIKLANSAAPGRRTLLKIEGALVQRQSTARAPAGLLKA